jgi:hypothetical protein
MDKETIELLTRLGKQLAYGEVLDLLTIELAKPNFTQQETAIIAEVIGSIKDGLMNLVSNN